MYYYYYCYMIAIDSYQHIKTLICAFWPGLHKVLFNDGYRQTCTSAKWRDRSNRRVEHERLMLDGNYKETVKEFCKDRRSSRK